MSIIRRFHCNSFDSKVHLTAQNYLSNNFENSQALKKGLYKDLDFTTVIVNFKTIPSEAAFKL